MTHLIAEITMRLERLGVKERMGVNRAKWSAAEKSIILKVVIAGIHIFIDIPDIQHSIKILFVFFLLPSMRRCILSVLFCPFVQ